MSDEKPEYKADMELLWEYEMNMFRNRSALRYLMLIYGLVALIIAASCLVIYLGMSRGSGVLSIIGWFALGTVGAGASAMNASRIGTQLETGSYRVCSFDTLSKVRSRPKYDLIQLTDPDKRKLYKHFFQNRQISHPAAATS